MRCTKRVCGTVTLHLGTLGILCLSAALAGAAPPPQKFVADELLVQFKAGVRKADYDSLLRGAGAREADEIAPLRVKKIKVPAAAIEKVKATLAKNPRVSFVENNYLAAGAAVPNDPSFGSQWHLQKIGAPLAWDISTGLATVDIAVVDSGVDPNHPDLSGKLIPGYNFLGSNTDTSDVLGHGTAVAGTAAAIANNATGVAGVAWKNPVMPLVVLDATNYASYANIAKAITYAADRGVRVINVSIGGTASSSTLQNAVNYAWNKGALVFASAMNNNSSTPAYPAACTNVVAVAATNSADAKASFSNYGPWITIAAPGEGIYTTNRGGGYGSWNGTSFSSPMTAGLAALVLSVNPLLTNAQVVDILKSSSDDLGAAGFDQYFGHGRINALKALSTARNTIPLGDTTAPTVTIASPATGTTVKGTATVSVSASDDSGVTMVELFVDGTLAAASTTAPYSFSWDSTTVTDGFHTLVAYAHDAAGNVGESSALSVSVMNAADTIAPTATFTSPANGATVTTKATVSVNATDNVGVTKMELFIDGKLMTTVSGTNLTYLWNCRKEAAGYHTIIAKAYDAAGNAGTTTITVYK